ncbi:DUF5671 domain-containing protein [Coralloluteibacterium thermophilus]|uniref:DUF5671 domain-containing protein n=1 Tax=Coralloluteibacterium thermophilum TaxID=2707049 RepID=A0ABV9NF84_9GAMM
MAAGSRELDAFVRDALQRGIPRAEVEAVLVRAGWPAERVRTALDAWVDLDFPIPVPHPRQSLSARDSFLHLLLFATLYISAWHLGSLLFDLVNLAFPDSAELAHAAQQRANSMRWSIASLTIAFPVFVFMARLLARELAADPDRRRSAVRQWLTWLTLFVAALVLIGDMIALVHGLLGGGLTVRFVLKAAIVAAIAGTVFGWYLRDLRRGEAMA